MPRFKKPDWFEMLDNYDQIRFYLRKWAEGCYPCMLMVGPPGRGKSKLAQIATQGRAHLIKCHGKPFSTYVEAQQYCATHPHDPKHGQYQNIILDDVDGLYADSDGQRLVKAFGESDRPVVVPWPTIAAGRAAVPKSFVFEGSILIIDNAWGVSEHLEAIEDRSRAFYVGPPAVEIHRYVGEWFLQTGMHDMIYKFIGDHLPLIAPLVSTRLYGHALNAEKAGEDWQEFLLKRAEVRVVGEDGEETVHRIKKEMLEAIRFELDPYWKGKPVEDKIEAWMQRTNMSRKTWYNYMKAYYAAISGPMP